jgi:hypothetical protein
MAHLLSVAGGKGVDQERLRAAVFIKCRLLLRTAVVLKACYDGAGRARMQGLGWCAGCQGTQDLQSLCHIFKFSNLQEAVRQRGAALRQAAYDLHALQPRLRARCRLEMQLRLRRRAQLIRKLLRARYGSHSHLPHRPSQAVWCIVRLLTL